MNTAGSVVVARDASGIAAMEREWRRLYAASGEENPFLRWEWQHAWAVHSRARPLVVAACGPEGEWQGLLALQLRRRHGLRQLEFLSQGSGADELDCLVHPQAAAGTAGRLLRQAAAAAGWDVMRLESARAGGALAGVLGAGAEPGERLPYLDLPEDFEALLRAHSANFRAEIRRRRRHFDGLAPGYRLCAAESATAVSEALGHLIRLHNQRRRQKLGTGIFEQPEIAGFHQQAAARLAAGGAARVYLLVCDRAVIAVLYGLCAGRSFYYFQSGFDPAWTSASPGTVLLSLLLEDCIARGVRRFEFLRGEEPYKRRWTSTERQSLLLRGQRGALGRAAGWARAWRRRARRWWP